MIYAGTKTVAAAGTPVPLAPTRTPACWVKIQGLDTNTKLIYVTGSGLTDSYNANSTTGTTGGVEVASGGIFALGDSSAINYYDLNKIYIDADVSAEGVKYLYGRR